MASLLRISPIIFYVKSNLLFHKPQFFTFKPLARRTLNYVNFFIFTTTHRKCDSVLPPNYFIKDPIFKANVKQVGLLGMKNSLQTDHNCIVKATHTFNSCGFNFDLTEALYCMGNLRLRNAALPFANHRTRQIRSCFTSSNYKVNSGPLSARSADSRRLKDRSIYEIKRSKKMGESSELVDSGIKRRQGSQKEMDNNGDGASFDICPAKNCVKSLSSIKLETPSHLKKKEKMLNTGGHYINVLRPGMLHLRRYISVTDQVKIVEICRKLGLGSGGFYQPGYPNGGKLKLKMMCLGKSWDPQRFGYGDVRPTDGAQPPSIPDEFHILVERAMQESHTYLRKQYNGNLEVMLPFMDPDICIVNFYSESGRLGLHQDKEESKESLMRGLPVVSLSIGDSAEFVYGDDRKNVEKVVLESGDVLIFGGCSRHIYHGVTTIFGETAPNVLLKESNLRPGRLNLTFRQY